jgi:cell division protein FtsZ
MITDEADSDAQVIFGAVIDENMQDEMRITIIATGFKKDGKEMITGASVKKNDEEQQDGEEAVSAEDIFEIFKKKK